MFSAKDARQAVDDARRRKEAEQRAKEEQVKQLVKENAAKVISFIEENIKKSCSKEFSSLKVWAEHYIQGKAKLRVDGIMYYSDMSLPNSESMVEPLYEEIMRVFDNAGYLTEKVAPSWGRSPTYIRISW